jgi:hypothetical protein
VTEKLILLQHPPNLAEPPLRADGIGSGGDHEDRVVAHRYELAARFGQAWGDGDLEAREERLDPPRRP